MKKHICGNCYFYDGSKCCHILNIAYGKAGIGKRRGYCKRWLSFDVMEKNMKELTDAIYKPLAAMAEAFILKVDELYEALQSKKKKGKKK
ncbi:MAG: hypothetical protein WC312_07885 [Candidatus Omnitrophota bacterium]|jgi:hypothetical protein